MQLIGLCGAAGAGKDTAASFLVTDGWTRVAFADPLKAVAYDLDLTVTKRGASTPYKLCRLVDAFGWDWVKLNCPEARGLLQRLGVAVRDHVDDDAWLNAALSKMDKDGKYVVTDARFPNECWAVKLNGGLLIHINRPDQENIAGNHISEQAWRDQEFDYVIHNVSTPEYLGYALLDIVANTDWS